MVMKGYVGRILSVDLQKTKVYVIKLDDELARLFLGGSGLSAKILYDTINFGAFDPRSKLVFMTGPLTGTLIPFCGRHVVCARSPLTNIWGEANSSGFWGPELKFAGYDGIIIEGKAAKPVYLWIHDDLPEIRDASHLWGKDTYETEDMIRKDHGDVRTKVACIGVAGERLSRIAAIMNDKGRAAGRCGLGAVMGSKKLKAIAVRGSAEVPIADKEELLKLVRSLHVIIRSSPHSESLRKYGTNGAMTSLEAFGDVPIKYWRKGAWSVGADRISGQVITKTILKGVRTCFRCPIACIRNVEIKDDRFRVSPGGSGPEYETCAAFGTLCLNDDLMSIAKCNDLCNRHGLDTISTGSVISFALECYERGLITKKDVDRLDLSWGNREAIIDLVEKIAKREGIGNILAEGVKRAAEEIGEEAKEFALHVKGLELPMHDPRAFESWALAYATSNRGACHLQGVTYWIERGALTLPDIGLDRQLDRFTFRGKARLTKTMQDFCAVIDSLVMCKFALYGGVRASHMTKLLSATAGWNIDLNELMRIGERLYNLKRLVNTKLGVTRKEDTLPKRILKEPTSDGGAKGHVPRLEPMLRQYYKIREWNNDGVPTERKIKELCLDDLADDNRLSRR